MAVGLCNSFSTIDMSARMFVVGRRVFAIVTSREFTGSFCHPWHPGPANPWRDDGSAEFLHNRLKQPPSSSRKGMPGPRRQGRQQDSVAALVALVIRSLYLLFEPYFSTSMTRSAVVHIPVFTVFAFGFRAVPRAALARSSSRELRDFPLVSGSGAPPRTACCIRRP